MTHASAAPELAPDVVVDLDIGEVAHPGVFVARHASGRVVFVADALPGERVRARITDVKKSHAQATTVQVLEAAPQRVEHVWSAASLDRDPEERAGGAGFGHVLPEFGRELKRRVIVDAMARFGGLDREDGIIGGLGVEALPGDDGSRGTGWRTRLTLHVDEDRRVGPVAARSHRIVPTDSLPLAFADIEELALAQIREGSRSPGRIDFVAPSDSEARMRRRPQGKPARAPEQLLERVHDREFLVGEDGFWQVHRHAAATLFDAVKEAIDPARFDAAAQHLDLYGGVGLLGAALAEFAGTADVAVESVESSRAATGFARRNLREWRRASAATASVDDYLRRLASDGGAAERSALAAGAVVLDPPRTGAKKAVVAALAELGPAQLVYVACDPVALGRDTGLLRERGYELVRLRAYDLFPNTHHVESVATFVRA
ncbi:class I SAM-dependent RNA methyltransferase [Gulosibacter sp. 10]|uniref:class I SAM-dependent RNA methyltransferase n=1 Tax=Gulosibacter sp. 10 TaxID=1255570 RepID=UPI00097EAF6E|nr:TRAM domain-containing protein [Gulosibacter sp. 10]SJM48013.1 23S rRNA (Uracil-5-)-methyltransferase RumA [Gulosibacter sp. 10]